MHTTLPAPTPHAAQDLRALIAASKALWGRPLPADEAEAERQIGILEKREKSVCDCLLAVIAGGTNVGKTTLINALAGGNICETSAKACSTEQAALYVHKNRLATAKSLLHGVLPPDELIVTHEREELAHLILVDTPDLDGIKEANRTTFARLLELADLVLVVVTAQKYDSEALFTVLTESMGFRRAVIVLNRLDEGMKTQNELDTIVADLRTKIGALALKTPLDEELPVFRISARYALFAKTGQGVGPRWDFPKLEEYLRKRLDATVAKRISAENQAGRALETIARIETACNLASARQAASSLRSWKDTFLRESREKLREAARAAVGNLAPELARRRESAAAGRLGGPFGAYVRASLAVSMLAMRFQSIVASPFGDPVTPLAKHLATVAGATADELLASGRRQVVETLDRAGLDPRPAAARIDASPARRITTEQLADSVRRFLDEPRPGRIATLLLNALPLTIILLLVRYFLTALLTAHDPAAGMFIGGGLLFWLVCHLQAGFWLARQAGTLDDLTDAVEREFSNELHRRLTEPLGRWADEVESLRA
ncbi:MAG TPA: 50S ribosome-binding GTPase [Candidatus Ozemobacteraceae bacterium]|nr:50S ribosome-binding GTPase [Candidatus Ozemobacteraceae bacterium]